MEASLYSPRWWPTWIGLGLLKLVERLPYPVICRIGRGLGLIARYLPHNFAHVARRNIELCLPELDTHAREQLVDEHFRALGITPLESAMTWWSSNDRIRGLAQIDGLENLDAALARGKGAILLTAHFTTTEMSARIINTARPIHAVYRPFKNLALSHAMEVGRSKHAAQAIPRDDIRSMIRALKKNGIVWYAPDQAYRKKGAEMVPFFGIPAASNTATTRIAQMTGATVLPFSHERLPDAAGYRVVIHPPLEGVPSEEPAADTLRFHHFVEAQVRRTPAQYWWIHRRFKGLDADYPDYYRRGPLPDSSLAKQ